MSFALKRLQLNTQNSALLDTGQLTKGGIVAVTEATGPLAQLRAGRPAQQHLVLGEDQLDQLLVIELDRVQPALHDRRQVLTFDSERTWHIKLLCLSVVCRPWSVATDYGPRTTDYSRWRRCGNRITSRIVAWSVSSITMRSMPRPRPPVGGIPYISALI